MAASSLAPKHARHVPSKALIWPPLKIGQRRSAGKASEDTLTSFDWALREGAEGIALDVQLLSDGVPMVIGDAPKGRKTAGSGER